MLRVVVTINNRRTLFLGLDRANTKRLHNGQPIVTDIQALGSTESDPIQDIVLCADETLGDLHTKLSKYLPLPPIEKDKE